MSGIDSWHWKISTGCHFQNGHHNTAQIQHCPISTTFHMWVDYDVPKWFLTLKNVYRSHFQNGHHNTAQIQHCSISTSWIDSRHWNISTGVIWYFEPHGKLNPGSIYLWYFDPGFNFPYGILTPGSIFCHLESDWPQYVFIMVIICT
jgi:hypothetical protein